MIECDLQRRGRAGGDADEVCVGQAQGVEHDSRVRAAVRVAVSDDEPQPCGDAPAELVPPARAAD
jgi:hypothetical protein